MNKKTPSISNKKSKMITKVVFVLAFSFFTNNLFSQVNTNNSTNTKVEVTGVPPYNNYKGIADIDEAKKAWFIDHPELIPVEVKVESITGVDERVKVSNNKVEIEKKTEQVVISVPENQPYLNYKGITDPKAARKLWIAENPEAAQKLHEKLQNSNSNQNTRSKVKQ